MRGALLGLASALVALAGFYAALTAVLAGQLGGGGHLAELFAEVGANRIYFLGGIVTGPILGAIGAWIGRHRPDSLWLVVGALVAGEILAVALVHGHRFFPARPLPIAAQRKARPALVAPELRPVFPRYRTSTKVDNLPAVNIC